MRVRLPLEDRFWQRVDKRGPDECWNWTGNLNPEGYGSLRVSTYRTVNSHRISWELTRGPIPAGAFVCHRCDNPSCVNPDHLWLGTPRANTLDMVAKGRWGGKHRQGGNGPRSQTCRRGHPRTEANTYTDPSGHSCCRPCKTIARQLREDRVSA